MAQSEYSKILKHLQAFEKKVDKRFDTTDKRMSGFDRRFDAIDERFEKVDKRFESIELRFDAIEFSHGKRFERIEERLDQHNKRFDEIIGAIDGLSSLVKDYQQEMLMLAHKVDRLERWIHEIAQHTGVKLSHE